MEARLQELLFTMKIPHWRADQKDWGHIARNLAIFEQNRLHPDFPEVMRLLRALLGSGALIVGEHLAGRR
ncbi:MAG: hypothetical protein Q8P76_00405 [bacterium]|nr:hypothetical protein [bacterium]